MQVGDPVALAFDRVTYFLRHARIRRAIEQDGPGIAQQSDGPVGDDKRADEPASGSIQSQPNARAISNPTMTMTDTAASAMT